MIGLISYSFGGVAFLLLSVWLFLSWRGRLKGGLLLFAVVATTLWLGVSVLHIVLLTPTLLHYSELLRNVAWLAFLFHLTRASDQQGWLSPVFRPFVRLVVPLFLLLLAMDVYLVLTADDALSYQLQPVWIYQYLLLSIVGLVAVEQSFRNARHDKRWTLKYMMLGLGGLFVYDFFLYSNALLFRQLNYDLWYARGLLYVLVVPLIAVSAARQRDWSLDVFMSRTVVFHGVGLAGAGIYLIVMAAAGYYIRSYGGNWGAVMQAVFLVAALMLLVVIMFSSQIRAAIKVQINKHFFNYKYDYRQEWLRFIDTIAVGDADTGLQERTIKAIAQIVDSPGGVLWLRDAENDYQVAARYNCPELQVESIMAIQPLPSYLQRSGWVVDLQEFASDSSQYDGLELPLWLTDLTSEGIILPLMHGTELVGMMLLKQPRGQRQINWEDRDLFKTVGRQAAGYLALMQASEALGEARQFEAFNRLSAFVVHDLKNVVAQLSLVVINAQRHRHKPAFIDDAFGTIDNAVDRMNRMLGHLRQDLRREGAAKELVNLNKVLQQVCERRTITNPQPQLVDETEAPVWVQGDKDRLAAVLEHVVQNAQDATAADGRVEIRLVLAVGFACIEIEDTGSGMDSVFIRDRLFKPFDTTKGNAGMGIGVYETREYIHGLGGKLSVNSTPGQGTMFLIRLPLSPIS